MEIKDILEKLKRNEISSSEAKRQIQYILTNKKSDFNPTHTSNSNNELSIEDVYKYVLEITATVLKFEISQIRLKEPLDNYGIDSIISVRLANAFEVDLGTLSKMLFFEYKNLEEVSQYFYEKFPEQLKACIIKRQIPSNSPPLLKSPLPSIVKKEDFFIPPPFLDSILNSDSDDIAIIGLSGKYPKSSNLEIFWENLKAGFNGIDKIPAERWDYREFYDAQKSRHGTMCTNLGGFIDGIDEFDDLLFKILPVEAKILDPQDRLFLQSVWESLEDAGYTRESIVKKTQGEVGVYVGIMTGDYSLLSARNAGKETNIFSNGISAEVANRTSYFFDFQGPSITLNTMCSSSLTALSLAYDALKQKRIQLAVVGGVNLSLHPNKFLILSDNNFLSRDGLCRSFGAGGSGYIPSEGCGSVILKPLKQALEDRDHIYGVIKSTAVNNCGRSNRYRVPMAKAQAKVIDQALSEANIHPRTISYIEAHGTGTELGDPVEIDGLNQAFSKNTQDKQFCSIGSVKSNMGHSEGAAGIASLTKVLLQMRYKTLVPSIHVEKPNPNIQFENTPFYVQQSCEPWKKITLIEEGKEKTYPRRAGVSSFGAGGTNVHVIVEEYEQKALAFEYSPLQDVCVLSAATKKQLKHYALKMMQFLIKRRSNPDYFSENDFQARLAYTLQVGRQSMNCRLVINFSDLDQLVAALSSFASESGINQYAYGEIDQKQVYVDVSYDTNNLSVEILKKDWVAGKTFSWENLWPSPHPRRLSLPTYPFEKRKFWINDSLPTFSEKIYDPSMEQKKSEEPLLFAVPKWSKGKRFQDLNQRIDLEEVGEKILLYPASYHSKISVIQLEEDIKEIIEIPTYKSGEDVLTGLHFISALTQKIMKEKRYARATFLFLVEESEFWKYAYLKGFFLSLIQEQPKFRMKMLLLPSVMKLDLKSTIEKEWLTPEQVVSYHSHERSYLTYQSIQRDQKFYGSLAKEGGVYWITGGVGGLGRLFAVYFGRQNKKLTLILSGRSALTIEQFQSLKEDVGPNVTLVYEQCDVSQKSSVSHTLGKILNKYNKIDGIIHSAGVIRDSLLIRKNLDHLQDVINPKVLGIINLDDATKDLSLDYLVFFSSESGAFGNVGQTDYAAANAFMDAFALKRNQLRGFGQRSGKTLSINWPLWKEGGMSVPEHIEKEIFNLTGMIPLESNSGTESLDFMLSLDSSQIVIAQGNVEKIKEIYSILSLQPEGDLIEPLKLMVQEDLLKDELPPQKMDISSDSDFIMIRKKVKELFSQVSQIGDADINEDVDFQDYGADSVIFSELANVFSREFAVEFTPSFFFTHVNLKEVALETYQLFKKRLVVPSAISPISEVSIPSTQNSQLIEVIGEEHKTYKIDLTGDEIFFRDHLLNSQKLFPATMHLELIAKVGKRVFGKDVVIENCIFDKPLFFDFKPISLFITLIPRESACTVNVWVSSTDGEKNYLAIGKISIAENNEEKVSKINTLESSLRFLSDKFVYDELASIGLEYKQAFRSIQKITIYGGSILSNLRLPNIVRLEDEVFPYPIIDGAFQSIIGFVKSGEEASPEIPYRIKGLRKYREFQEFMNVLIKQKDTFIYTLEFYNEEGYLIAICDEFETKPLIKKITLKKSTCIDQLKQMISKITHLPFESIDPSLPLTQLALGNFEFVELQKDLETHFLMPIPFALFRNNENLEELAQKLDRITTEKILNGLGEEITLSPEITQMTDEEAEACLNKELLLK